MECCLATEDGVVMVALDGDRQEVLRFALKGHFVTTVVAEDGMLLAGTRRGVFRSDDLGEEWHLRREGMRNPHVRSLSIHPNDRERLFAGTEPAAIYRSTDGGLSWHERPEIAAMRRQFGWYLPYSPEAGCIRDLAWYGRRGYAATEVGGLLTSDDGGETWRLVAGSSGDPHAHSGHGQIHPDVHSVAVHPLSPGLLLAPTGGGLYRSANGGESWSLLYRCYCRAVWLDPQDPDHLLFGPADGVDRNGRLEETFDGGETWQDASMGVDTPWRGHMVERLVAAGRYLFAVLSNGELIVSAVGKWVWRPMPETGGRVNDVTALPHTVR